MKVYIGPYKDWFGPYQIADLLQYIGFSKDTCYKIGERLSKTFLNTICIWIDSKKKRKTKVKIHDYDIWNLDHTLSLIILPALLKLKEDKSGVPNVSNEDIPDDLKTDSDDFNIIQKKWEYVLNEIIFAFQSQTEDWKNQFNSGNIDIQFKKIDNEDFFEMVNGPNHTFQIDSEGRDRYQKRISNGFILFGKYYESLWT